MKNKILADYQQDVLSLFKGHYKKLITKSVNITFQEILDSTLEELSITNTKPEETEFLESWFHLVHQQSFLKDYIKEDFTEIIFHSHEHVQVIKVFGRQSFALENIEASDFQMSLEILAMSHEINWNFKEPFASFNIKLDGRSLRATLVHFSTSANLRSKLFLRSMGSQTPSLNLFQPEHEALNIMQTIIAEKKNVLISGGTGSGKTTLLRSLLSLIPEEEHIIVLEDTYEILNHHPGQTSFLANKQQINKSLKDYCAYSLRMSPDRLIVGEMRSNEVVPFVLAMNTGHKGLISTIHANSGVDALSRIALLFSLYSESKDISFKLVTKLVCKNIDYVIHVEHKKIVEICKVLGSDAETPFYERLI